MASNYFEWFGDHVIDDVDQHNNGNFFDEFGAGLAAGFKGAGSLIGFGPWAPRNYRNEIASAKEAEKAQKEQEAYALAHPESAKKAEMSSREWDEYLLDKKFKMETESDATKYQRTFADLKAAGLNPRLLLEGGSAQANGVSASSGFNASENRSETSSSSNSYSSSAVIASLITAAAVLIKHLL